MTFCNEEYPMNDIQKALAVLENANKLLSGPTKKAKAKKSKASVVAGGGLAALKKKAAALGKKNASKYKAPAQDPELMKMLKDAVAAGDISGEVGGEGMSLLKVYSDAKTEENLRQADDVLKQLGFNVQAAASMKEAKAGTPVKLSAEAQDFLVRYRVRKAFEAMTPQQRQILKAFGNAPNLKALKRVIQKGLISADEVVAAISEALKIKRVNPRMADAMADALHDVFDVSEVIDVAAKASAASNDLGEL
jgi:hypothetical protein